MKKHKARQAQASWRMHDPHTGFIYFTAGAAQWQPARDGSGWVLRFDVVFQQPTVFRCPDASTAQRMAVKLARDFERGCAEELVPVDVDDNGRVLFGSLPQRSYAGQENDGHDVACCDCSGCENTRRAHETHAS